MDLNEKLKRIIVLLLTAVLVAGMLPLPAVASDAGGFVSNVIDPLLQENEEEDFGEPDPSADLETEEDYIASLKDVRLKGLPYNEKLIAVAETQLGYSESENNFIVREYENGQKEKAGYTRYGAWYGHGFEYEDWCAMFISFCLNYAKVPVDLMPQDSGVITWMHKLQNMELYRYGREYLPKSGDLVFFDYDLDGQGDHVGIVNSVFMEDDVEMIETIEGNHTRTVEKFTYPRQSLEIMGYGVMSSEVPEDEQETQIFTDFLSVDGSTYRVTMTYTPDAEIPENAEVRVSEILPGTEEYAAYVAETEGALGMDEGTADDAKVLDICIFADDVEIQPAAPISVEVTLLDQGAEAWNVVHFSEEEAPQVLESSSEGDVVTFETEGFSIFVFTKAVIEKTLDASDGNTYKITVTYDSSAGIPDGAQLAVSEITHDEGDYLDYLDKAAAALEISDLSYVKLFDISIADQNDPTVHHQPQTPVEVSVQLLDAEDSTSDFSVVHFDTQPEVLEATTSGDTVSFTTDGFSAYAIVQGPAAISVDWHKVESIDELISRGSQGLYIGHPDGYYYGNTLKGNSSRMGIVKTKPAQPYPPINGETTVSPAQYYFEAVEGTDNQVYAYCFATDGTTKQYVYNGGNNSLSFTTENKKTAFTVTQNDGTFTLNNGAWYWNMQGGASGERFCSYNTVGDVNNNVNFWYYDDITGDPYNLNGKTYGLMNWNGGVAGKALMNTSTENSLNAKSLTVMSTANNQEQLFVPNESDISMWTFHWIDEDNYNLTTIVDGSTKYLRIDNNGLSLVSESDDSCKIQVVPGSGTHTGEICLKSGNTTLTYSGSIDGGFTVGGSAGTEWLHFVVPSELTEDYFRPYSANKVSVSGEEVSNGSRVIVYTRAWNENKMQYDFYAINSDGTLVPVYESGDSIEWVGGQINTLLWNFVEYYWDGTDDPTFYYELYNQYSEKYISPQIAGNGQTLSDNTIGINLNGRRDGKYYTTILAWDDENYSYAGLKVENGQIVSCPKSEAMDFFFATVEDLNIDDDLHTVNTVDHTQYGITMKIIDLENTPNQNGDMSQLLGSSEGGAGRVLHQGLLSTHLGEDGYPTAVKTNRSLNEMYSGTGLREVNHLFIESTYYSSGYFEYDSTQNYAYLDGTNFKVYKELGSYDSAGGRNTLKHGQFFPFNDLQAGVFTSVNGKNLYTFDATSHEKPLDDSDPRKYEQLYSLENSKNNKVDPYFAVELEASFTQTPSGLDAWGHDIIFEFTGDDDFWLYVDGELVIDLGGIHSSVPGSVNFRTGAVYVNGKNTTLRALFEGNYRKRNTGASDTEVAAYLAQFFDGNSTVFKDDTTHTMKMFYMERGAGASNLKMRFNLAAVKRGTVQLSKTLTGVDEGDIMAEFPYQIIYKTSEEAGAEEYYLRNGIVDSENQKRYYVFYKDSVNPVKYESSIEIGGNSYNDVFFLKPGETADINFPEGMTSYRIVECGVNTEVYSSVSVNGETISGTPNDGKYKDFGIGYATTDGRAKVNYANAVNPDALRTLTFKKKLFDESGETPIHYDNDQTEFNFRLYLASEFDELDVANMHIYHVKDSAGNYCKWDAVQQKFVSLGQTNYSDLTDTEKDSASFNTSVYGQISKIPADYTVEIRNVLAGTQYRVEERPNEIPDGYSFQRYDEYDRENARQEDKDSVPGINGTVVSGADPSVTVRNLKGWGLRVNKVWRDEDYMSNRDATYFALFTKNSSNQLMLVSDSVRQLPYNANPQTIYWYYNHLPVAGTSGVGDYCIREVTITNNSPDIGPDGVVSNYGTVTPIEGENSIQLYGTQKGEDTQSIFNYIVLYTEGQISSDSNVRVDVVTNDRPGIILKKQDWSGNALEGAVFKLKDGENLIGTFTSGEDGIITTAFLSNNKNYTLTETSAPQMWHGMESAMTILVNTDGSVEVSSPDEEYYTLQQAQGSTLATLIIKNRPYTFEAIKKDGDTNTPLNGVTFALHRQVTVDGVTNFDVNPMPGYDALTTDENGVIPKLDKTLPAGTYELREKEAPAGYQPLSGYIHFTISTTGAISLIGTDQQPVPDGVTLEDEEKDEGTLQYVLTILNSQRINVSFKKVSSKDETSALAGAVFDLYSVTIENGVETRQIPALYTGLTSDNDGLLTDSSGKKVFDLPVGKYHLVETTAPAGYNIRTAPAVLTVTASGVTCDSDVSPSYDTDKKIFTVKVPNTPGIELPKTGGMGTEVFTSLGGAMTAAAGAMLLRKKKKTEEA